MKVLKSLLLLLLISTLIIMPLTYASSTIGNIARNLKKSFESTANTIVGTISDFLSYLEKIIVKLSEVLAIGLAVVGCFLWFSGISPYSGKRMVISAALLALFAYVLKVAIM